MMDLMMITVKNQFEGIHCYPDAPEGVEFLKNPHRHMFHVESEIEVYHDDRELEFILVQRNIQKFLDTSEKLQHKSCEMIAREVRDYLRKTYPIEGHWHRKMSIRVSEDGENGVYLKEI